MRERLIRENGGYRGGRGGICDLRDSTIGIFWINGPGSLPFPAYYRTSFKVQQGKKWGVGKVIQEPNFRKLRLHLASATLFMQR